jgi:hypothetical protein
VNDADVPAASKALCQSCNAPIIWTVTAAGKPMPVDRAPGGHGDTAANLKLTVVGGVVRSRVLAAHLAFGNTSLHLSHFVRCPQSKVWRKPSQYKRRSTPR